MMRTRLVSPPNKLIYIPKTYKKLYGWVYLIPLLLLFNSSFAQEKPTVIQTDRCDTAQVDALLIRSRQVFESNNDSTYFYVNKAIQLSYRCGMDTRIVKSLTEMAAWYFGHNSDQAIVYGHRAIQEYERLNSGPGPRKGNIYKAYNVLAKAYETKGKIDSSAQYYYLLNDAIDKGEYTDPEYAVSVYTQLAMFWINTNWDINGGYVDPSLFFLEKATQAEKKIKNTSAHAFSSYMLKGAYYMSKKDYDSARYFYLEFLTQREKAGTSNATWASAMYLNTAEAYLEENRNTEAIDYLNKALALKNKLLGAPRYMMIAQLFLSRALYQQKQYEKSLAAFDEAFTIVNKNDVLGKEVIEAYKVAGNAYEALGQKDKAIEYKNTYSLLHDSLMQKDKLDMMNKLQVLARITEKDKKLAEQKLIITQNEASARKKNFLIAGISMFTIFIGVLFLLWQRNNRNKQRLHQQEMDAIRQKMAIDNLQAMIDGEEKERTRIARELHDGIGGLLAAAKMNFELVKKNYHLHNKADFQDGLTLLSEASTELRKTAHNMMPEILLQEGLVEAVGHFCKTVARNSPVKIHFQTLGDLQKFSPTFELAVYRVVQELVHNILKHARATEALIQMGFGSEMFDLSIEDNGIGIPDNIIKKSNGMGLKSIEDRLKAINGKMTIQNIAGGGTGIYLEISLQKENILS